MEILGLAQGLGRGFNGGLTVDHNRRSYCGAITDAAQQAMITNPDLEFHSRIMLSMLTKADAEDHTIMATQIEEDAEQWRNDFPQPSVASNEDDCQWRDCAVAQT